MKRKRSWSQRTQGGYEEHNVFIKLLVYFVIRCVLCDPKTNLDILK